MAQWRKTFDSLGGPTYIADPRVDEQARLGELLLARQRAAADQQDRLFGRRQQLESEQARLGEGRRQFDAELAQRQLEARQRLEQQSGEAARAQANADRAFGLDDKRLAQQDEQAFREQAARDSAFYASREAEKQRQLEAEVNRIDMNARANEAERRADKRLAQQNAIETQREVGRDSRQAARDKALADRAAADRAAAEDRQREELRLAREREDRLREQVQDKAAAEQRQREGTVADQRKWAIQAREQRFQAALERLAPRKGGRLGHEAQAEAVRQAYREATSPDVDPQRRTYEAAVLGDEGEAEANARLAAIADEFFPEQTYIREEQGYDPLAILGDLAVNNLLPDALRERLLGAIDPAKVYKVSGGRQEADKLFGRKRR